MGSNKLIIKNSAFLYIRMLFTIIVSLYTSRVILEVLKVDDYGIYQIVGGITTMFSFIINSSLSFSSSRFITYTIGTNDKNSLKETFSSLMTIHIIFAITVAVMAEIIGLWLLHNKLVIPPDRIDAAVIVFHISVITTVVNMTQVPYSAMIIGHEKMDIYAYMSIIEVSLKLIIVYLLTLSTYDKLIYYAILLFCVRLCITMFYRIYCIKHYKEAHYNFIFNKEITKKVLNFSSWNLLENISISLNSEGMNILLNMIFAPGIVAARGLSETVSRTATQFINNFRTAVNPQIVKRYSSEDLEGSKKLVLTSTKYSFYMMYILALPIFITSENLLSFWLKEVPEYTNIFLKFAIVATLFETFNQSFYVALTAKGQIKESTLWTVIIGFINYPIVFFMFKTGYSPIALSAVLLCYSFIMGVIIKPILLNKIMHYSYSETYSIIKQCLLVASAGSIIPFITVYQSYKLIDNSIIELIILSFVSVVSVSLSIWIIGIEPKDREMLITFIKNKIHKKYIQ